MLLQSHAGEIHLLPALPPAWADGEVRGLRARGGLEVDIAWQNGALTKAMLRPSIGGTVRVRVRGSSDSTSIQLTAGQPWEFEP